MQQAFEVESSKSLEASVISILMRNADLIDEVSPVLTQEMFTEPYYHDIYGWICEAKANGKPIGPEVIAQKLIGGVYGEWSPFEYVRDLSLYDKSYTDEERRDTLRRKAQAIQNVWRSNKAKQLINRLNLSPGSADEEIKNLVDNLTALESNDNNSARSIADIVEANKDDYFKEREAGHTLGIHQTLDRKVFLENGDVVVIGARPAVGKSALVQQIATNLANQGMKVGFFSLEMTEAQMFQRLASSYSTIDLATIRTSTSLVNEQKSLWNDGNDKLKKLGDRLSFHFGSFTVPQIRATVKNMKYDVIIIDYLQLIRATDRYKGARVAEVGEISKGLKALAMDMNIPVILLSQLNRGAEYTESKEPTMADLRESGDIEQDASIVMLLWNLDDKREYKALKVDKNRMGECLTVVLKFNGSCMQFNKDCTMDMLDYQKMIAGDQEASGENRGQNKKSGFKNGSDSYLGKRKEDLPWEG